MKNIILNRIETFKQDEDYFKSIWWKNNFLTFTNPNNIIETKHISEVEFSLLNDDDLIRLFEYIILCKNDISGVRVIKTYYKSPYNI
jgi:hypothetical protein